MYFLLVVKEWEKRETFEASEEIDDFDSVVTYIVGRKKDKKPCVKVFMKKQDDDAELFFRKQGKEISNDTICEFVNIKEQLKKNQNEAKEIQDYERRGIEIPLQTKQNLNRIVNEEAEKIYAKYSNVVRIGISGVLHKNQTLIYEPCIVLYCLDKNLIPFGENPLPEYINGYPCDIREDVIVFGSCEHCNCLNTGCDIGSKYSAGSAGFFVNFPFEGFLTAAHVTVKNVRDVYQFISDNFDKTTNGQKEVIMHPSSSQNMVGEVEKCICGNYFSYGTDVAIVRKTPLTHTSKLAGKLIFVLLFVIC